MNFKEKKMQDNIAHFLQQAHKILPIIDIATAINLNGSDESNTIVPIIEALVSGGVRAIEITLRNHTKPNATNSTNNAAAYLAIETVRKRFPELFICVGTVTSEEQIHQLKNIDIDFIVSPCISSALLAASQRHKVDILPGISTPSDILLGLEFGLQYFKFFPAELSGGTKMLQALNGPFNHLNFCATGGINESNLANYLALHNVFCVGGSWLASKADIENKDWAAITTKTQRALTIANEKS
ncbi:MAG: 2-dehydro-3-deoxyphosphogluconate aldolase/(4S)-4-hydroxy-2-oxoglutarate aldolase [Kiritimatiellia bacterium]